MSINEREIEGITVGERIVLGWDVSKISTKIDSDPVSAEWEVEEGDVVITSESLVGNEVKAFSDYPSLGCSVVKITVTFADTQKRNLFFKLIVDRVACS